MVGTTLDDREDYMETTPRRLRTTTNDHERPTTRVVSDRIEFYPDDPKRPRDDQKRQKRLYGNIRDDPKRADTTQNRPTMHFSSQRAAREVRFQNGGLGRRNRCSPVHGGMPKVRLLIQ